MPCFKPLDAYMTPTGAVVFYDSPGVKWMQVPCGRCIGCRMEMSRGWTLRCIHEAKFHKQNDFITLTYNRENLPEDTGLKKKDFQDFMKRLRKHLTELYPAYYCKLEDNLKPDRYKIGKKKGQIKIGKNSGITIKYYYCGEYGEKGRPHYHAILFGYKFPDRVWIGKTKSGNDNYTSPTLERIWNKGYVQVGEVNEKSISYVSRYVMKKLSGESAEKVNDKTGLKPYERYQCDEITGEVIRIVEVMPEYQDMSRGGVHGRGIGYQWINRYSDSCYPKDFTTIDGMKMKPPRYYDEKLKELDSDMYDSVKAERNLRAYVSEDNTDIRLEQKENYLRAKLKQQKRTLS